MRGKSTPPTINGSTTELIASWILRQDYQAAFTINISGRIIQDRKASTLNDPKGEKNWSIYTVRTEMECKLCSTRNRIKLLSKKHCWHHLFRKTRTGYRTNNKMDGGISPRKKKACPAGKMTTRMNKICKGSGDGYPGKLDKM